MCKCMSTTTQRRVLLAADASRLLTSRHADAVTLATGERSFLSVPSSLLGHRDRLLLGQHVLQLQVVQGATGLDAEPSVDALLVEEVQARQPPALLPASHVVAAHSARPQLVVLLQPVHGHRSEERTQLGRCHGSAGGARGTATLLRGAAQPDRGDPGEWISRKMLLPCLLARRPER